LLRVLVTRLRSGLACPSPLVVMTIAAVRARAPTAQPTEADVVPHWRRVHPHPHIRNEGTAYRAIALAGYAAIGVAAGLDSHGPPVTPNRTRARSPRLQRPVVSTSR
jgi:hypothetical protein